jgi:hypothetical protein
VEVRVAAVDDRVALVGDPEQLVEGVLCDLPGRNHQPEGTWRLELLLELGERIGRPSLDLRVIGLDLVSALPQSRGHAVAHPAEADHPQLHQRSPPDRIVSSGRENQASQGRRERS